jgi:hypothetical protein
MAAAGFALKHGTNKLGSAEVGLFTRLLWEAFAEQFTNWFALAGRVVERQQFLGEIGGVA